MLTSFQTVEKVGQPQAKKCFLQQLQFLRPRQLNNSLFDKKRQVPHKNYCFYGGCLLLSKAISTVQLYADEFALNKFTFLFPRLPACR